MGDRLSGPAWTGAVIALMVVIGCAAVIGYFKLERSSPPAASASYNKGDRVPQAASTARVPNENSIAQGAWPGSSSSAFSGDKSSTDLYASIDESARAMDRYRPNESFERIDDEIRGMPSGQIAFNVPSVMKRHDTASIELLLDVHKTIDQLKQMISYSGSRAGAQVKFSDQMGARLTGSQFQITANQPEIQAVGSMNTVKWTWDVVPNASGKLSLHLTLSAFIDVGQSRSPTVVQTFDRNIEVRVTTGEWVAEEFGEHWEWLATTLVIPAGAFAWKRWRRHGGPAP